MPRSPQDFTPIVGFPMAGEKNDIMSEGEDEIIPMQKIDWRAVISALRKTKGYHRTAALLDTFGAFVFLLAFVGSGNIIWLFGCAISSAMLAARAIVCWRNRPVHPLTINGFRVEEINRFLTNIGIKLPLKPGKYQLIVMMDVQPKGYIIWNAGARRLK